MPSNELDNGAAPPEEEPTPTTVPMPDSAPSVSTPDFGSLLEEHLLNNSINTQPRVEEALELHEDIDLQAFIERKVWIEEKIQFLGTMPPIEVFIGMDAVRESAEQVPGLPTRAELTQMEAEHDLIEKETEIFDSGELKKLRKFTKAATQRNLSPEDTDLIELTLNTIYALDKLLHLLRDRSDSLDLLSIRLSWEEKRISSWETRRTIVNDMFEFLEKRARWSPSTYEFASAPPISADSPLRRGSTSSIASEMSASPALSRSARFKLAENLARDAAQFASRLNTLRHSKVLAAGKVLDKLVDNSRKPVPEELLDEQDKLEDRCITAFEQVSGFLMDIVAQWKKADEIYIETMKDQNALQMLSEEIQTACTQHPTAKQSASYVSRAEALSRRLATRGKPLASATAFPRPEHALFPDQKDRTSSLASSLLEHVSSATLLAQTTTALAQKYRASYEAVKRVQVLCEEADTLENEYRAILEKLEQGVGGSDGTPPDLRSETCLEPTRHAKFLGLLPEICERQDKADERCSLLLRQSNAAILGIGFPGVDPELKSATIAAIERLTKLRDESKAVREALSGRVSRLSAVRSIWHSMDQSLKHLIGIRNNLCEAVERERWRQQVGKAGVTPSTPDSPATSVVSSSSLVEEQEKPAAILVQVDTIHQQLQDAVVTPLRQISPELEVPLNSYLSDRSQGLSEFLESVRQTTRLLESIEHQAGEMHKVREEFGDFQLRIETAKLQLDANIQGTFEGSNVEGESELVVKEKVANIAREVQAFLDSLPKRVIFVAQNGSALSPRPKSSVKRTFSADSEVVLGKLLPGDQQIRLPFNLAAVDDAVRADSNSYAMRIAGDLKGLQQKANHFHLAIMAKQVDAAVLATTNDIHQVSSELASYKQKLSELLPCDPDAVDTFSADADSVFRAHRSRIARSFSPIRDLLRQMDASPGSHDTAVHEVVYLSRIRTVDDAELKFNSWDAQIASFRVQIAEVRTAEIARVEQERVLKELQIQAEKDRLEAAEAERIRIEAEEKEREHRRVQEEWIAKERAWQEEKDRQAAEAEERVRWDNEQKEKERLAQLQLEEERRVHEEQVRQAAEQVEQMRLQAETAAKEARIAEEHRLEAEERVARELVERERLRQIAEDTRVRLESEKQALSELHAHEKEEREQSLAKERLEREAMEHRKTMNAEEEDVFGSRLIGVELQPPSDDLQIRIAALRKRLLSMNLSEIAKPALLSPIPTEEQMNALEDELAKISQAAQDLPAASSVIAIKSQLQSLNIDLDASLTLMNHIRNLVAFSKTLALCDAALSDLIEHTDSYPSSPAGPFLSTHTTSFNMPPEEQLSSRLAFTKALLDDLEAELLHLNQDPRAHTEHTRVLQTWSELRDISNDLIAGRQSRSISVASSSASQSSMYNSNSSPMSRLPLPKRKSGAYPLLSLNSSMHGRMQPPGHNVTARRAVSGNENQNRPRSQASQMASNRSVSGSLVNTIYGSTYASRQRTASLSSPSATPVKRPPLATPIRLKPPAGQTPTDLASRSYSGPDSSRRRSTSSMSGSVSGSWSRTPRHSLSTTTPANTSSSGKKSNVMHRKAYVPNPKNKLDVAVGDVVNKLPINIQVEVVAETWKDQSGKYWIGDQDPRLCFCRILRSQTVMVRVGGGWMELSKFIHGHFADAFRLMPGDSPQRPLQEEKWISSATLLPLSEAGDAPPINPRTPERRTSLLPSVSLSSPNATSPRSIHSTPSKNGSPLTPLQFIRRAGPETPVLLRPSTPQSLRPRISQNAPSRQSIWRP